MVKILLFPMHRLAATPWTDGQTDRIPEFKTSLIGRGNNYALTFESKFPANK